MNTLLYEYNLKKHIINYNPYKISKYIQKINNNLHLQEGGEKISFFNKETQLLENVDLDIYFNNRNKYISLKDKNLQNLADVNSICIKKLLKPNKFYHISNKPIKNIKNTKDDNASWFSSPYSNPKGLWISYGPAWIDFVNTLGNKLTWTLATYVYEIQLNKTVLHIKNIKEFEKFINTYKNDDDVITFDNVINWKKVKNDYDGLVIYPYLGNEIWGIYATEFGFYGYGSAINDYIIGIIGEKWKHNLYFLAEWYRHWETSSGVIWSNSGIKNYKLVKRLTTFDKL